MLSPDERAGYSQGGALAVFWYDVGLMERMLYKNKNQHRHTLHFQRLQQVHRILSILQKAPAATLRELVDDASAASEPRALFVERSVGLVKLLNQLVMAIEAASKALGALLAQSFFMPFALTMFACLARIHSIASRALERVAQRRSEAVNRDVLFTSACEIEPPASLRASDYPLGASPTLQPSLQAGPVSDRADSQQSAGIREDTDPPLETWPPGVPIPSSAKAGLFGNGPGERSLDRPLDRWPDSEELESRGDLDMSSTLAEAGTSKQVEILGRVETLLEVGASAVLTAAPDSAALAGVSGNALVSAGVTPRSTALLDFPAQTVEVNPGRKRRAAAWLEELELGTAGRKADTWQAGVGSSAAEAATKMLGHEKGEPTRDSGGVRQADLTDVLLAGTDFEGFGGFGAREAARGPRKKKRKPA